MNYEIFEDTTCKYDDISGVCANNPAASALQEILLVFLKELSYYLLQLKKFGANNEVIKTHVIDAISGIITHVDYNQIQFREILMKLYSDLREAKIFYDGLTKKNKLKPKFIKSCVKGSNSLNIAEIIKKGEKFFIQKSNNYSDDQKNLMDLMVLIVKRFCLKIIQLESYGKNSDKAYESILELLNSMNSETFDVSKIKNLIEKSIQEYNVLIEELYDTQEQIYGKRESVSISFTPRNGKAILVSGVDLTQLETVLKLTKDRGLDVYTHGMIMLMAHTLPKFREYPNLVGHFGRGSENSLFDFAAFPGAILMTKYLFQQVEYLYRGKLFTTDSLAPSGISKIKDDDYEPLIKAALASKGFTKPQQEVIQRVGFRQKVVEEKVQEIIGKMETNEIKHLYFVGILNNKNAYKEYFDKFFKLMPKDCYAISLDYENNEENILHVDSFYDYLLIYRFLDEFKNKKPLTELNITIFLTKCDQYTATNILNFISMGIKHVFLCKCLPTIISPALVETIRKAFGVEEFSTPEEDIEKTLKQEG